MSDFLSYISFINNNRLFWGVTMLTMNLGSKYIFSEISQAQERFIMSSLFKKFVLLCIFFISTRDILTAAILAALFSLTIQGVLNEKTKYNLLSKSEIPIKAISVNEYLLAKRTIEQYHTNQKFDSKNDVSMVQQYKEKLKSIDSKP